MNPRTHGKHDIEGGERDNPLVTAGQVQDRAAGDGEQLGAEECRRGAEGGQVPADERVGFDTVAEGMNADIRHHPVERLDGDERQPGYLGIRQAAGRDTEFSPGSHGVIRGKADAIYMPRVTSMWRR